MALNLQKSAYQTDLWASAVCRHYTGKSKFLPVQPHRCDAREYKLLTRINALLGGIANIPPYDFGVAYAANALRLLGTTAVLTGVRAQLARELVAQNHDVESLVTRMTLQSGIAYAESTLRTRRPVPRE